jgi:hypothetical protein
MCSDGEGGGVHLEGQRLLPEGVLQQHADKEHQVRRRQPARKLSWPLVGGGVCRGRQTVRSSALPLGKHASERA